MNLCHSSIGPGAGGKRDSGGVGGGEEGFCRYVCGRKVYVFFFSCFGLKMGKEIDNHLFPD